MHIAVMGGTFNPVHFGHLRVAEEVREALGLDKIVFMPAFAPPHKTDGEIAPPEARMEMVRIAASGNPGFEVSDMEIKRGSVSFTIDTVAELRKAGGDGLKVSLIIGSDSFNDISTWCEYERLVELSCFIVVPRPGYPAKKPAEALPVVLARKFWYDSESDSYPNSFGTRITYLSTTMFDVSSSDIRRRIKGGGSIRYLMPDPVIEYIGKSGLYR